MILPFKNSQNKKDGRGRPFSLKPERRSIFLRPVIAICSAGGCLLLSKDRFPRELDLIALLADALHHDLLAFLQLITHVANAAVRDLRDVEQTIKAGQNFYECAEINYPRYSTQICLADLRFRRQRLNTSDRGLCRIAVGCCDEYRSVVLDVDL